MSIVNKYILFTLELFFLCMNPKLDSWKSQYKNVGLGQNKHVGLPTFLFCLFTRFLLRTEADLLTYMMVR